MNSSKTEWYVLCAVSGQEKKVKAYLESEIERLRLQAFILQVLIPMEKVFEMRNGKKNLRERITYPGYILIEANLNSDIIATIKDTPSAINFLGAEKGGNPVPLRQSEVNQILGKVNEMTEADEVLEEPFLKGESVKVMAGAFSGFDGVVDEIYEDKKKLKVVVKLFGRNTPVELNYYQVEKVI
jgi:transcription termination/antitermination protein NusG